MEGYSFDKFVILKGVNITGKGVRILKTNVC